MSLNNIIAKGTFWTAIGKYMVGFTNILVIAILSRIISPTEFGIVAMVLSITLFVNVLAEAGIGSAIIQKKDLNIDDLSTIYWFSFAISIIMGLLIFLFAPFLASFYKDSQIILITQVMSINYIFLGLLTVPLALLRQKLLFKQVAYVEIFSSIFSGIIAIILALLGLGYWALVIQTLILNLLRTITLIIYLKWIPNFVWKNDSIKKVIGYSSYVFGFNTINYWARNADNFLIGKFLGPTQLGFYDHAYKLMMFPLQILTGVIYPVLHPVFSSIQEDLEKINKIYLNVIKIIALISFPLSALLWVLAEPLVLLVWGTNWAESIIVFKILAILAAIQPIVSTSGNIFQVRNEVKLYFWVGLIGSFIMIIGFLIGLKWGITGVAIGYLITNFMISIPIMYLVIVYSLKGSMKSFFIELIHPFQIGIIILFTTAFVKTTLSNMNNFVMLLFPSIVAFMIFMIYVWLVERDIYYYFYNKIITFIKNRRVRQ